jgi:hypothetical protein
MVLPTLDFSKVPEVKVDGSDCLCAEKRPLYIICKSCCWKNTCVLVRKSAAEDTPEPVLLDAPVDFVF